MNANEIQIGDILLFDTCWSSDEADATEDFKPCRKVGLIFFVRSEFLFRLFLNYCRTFAAY